MGLFQLLKGKFVASRFYQKDGKKLPFTLLILNKLRLWPNINLSITRHASRKNRKCSDEALHHSKNILTQKYEGKRSGNIYFWKAISYTTSPEKWNNINTDNTEGAHLSHPINATVVCIPLLPTKISGHCPHSLVIKL